MTALPQDDAGLFAEIRQLIDGARQRAAMAVNAELTLLYWQIGQRIRRDVLNEQRADYGAKVIATLSGQLSTEYGKGWGERQLRTCMRFAEVFPDQRIVHTLCAELSWSHLRLIAAVDDPLKREFYTELARLERWSVRQLQERMQSMLFERSAISRKPEETIRHDLQTLRQQGQPSPDLLLKDPLPARLPAAQRPLPGARPRRRHPARNRAVPAGAGRRLHLRRAPEAGADRIARTRPQRHPCGRIPDRAAATRGTAGQAS